MKPPNFEIAQRDSQQIECLRVLCITAMMWVHVTPGLSSASFVSSGEFRIVGDVFGHSLGRISVAVLSFLSGYLFWLKSRHLTLASLLAGRFRDVYVPVLVWSAIYLVLAFGRETILGQPSSALQRIGASPVAVFNAWTGATGPTANLSLLFVRDLLVATAILRLLVPVIDRAPVIVALGVVAISLPQSVLSPLLFRIGILQFLLMGALTARSGLRLADLSRPRVAIVAGYGLILVAFLVEWAGPGRTLLGFDPAPMMRRAGIGFLTLALTSAIIDTPLATKLIGLGRHSFLAYLIHVPMIGIFWVFWLRLVGSEHTPGYVIFFLFVPIAVFAVAARIGTWLDHAPEPLSHLLRGRARRRAGHSPPI